MFLEQLSSGFSLQLAATRAATSASAAAQERISKTVYVRMQDPDTGATVLRERSIRSASPAKLFCAMMRSCGKILVVSSSHQHAPYGHLCSKHMRQVLACALHTPIASCSLATQQSPVVGKLVLDDICKESYIAAPVAPYTSGQPKASGAYTLCYGLPGS